MTPAQEIGNRIRILRKQMGISQSELAARADFHYSLISRYERGDGLPNAIYIVRIARELYTSAEYLVTGEENEDDD